MDWYIRSIERHIEADKARKRDDAAFLLWLIFECRAATAAAKAEA